MALSLSMVMARKDATLAASDVVRELATSFPELPEATDVDAGEGTLAFRLGDVDVILGEMPAPIPWSDLEGPCATSVLWRDAETEVKAHGKHWIVTLRSELEPIERAELLTKVTAAVLSACAGAIGVYWGDATLVVPKPVFVDFAREVLPHELPLHVWIDYRVGRNPDGSTGGFTYGMHAFGHMELETVDSPEPPSAVHDRLLAITRYLLTEGPVIRDGDTVGGDAKEKIRVVHSDSAFGLEGKVMRLVYETASPKKPWWKL